MLFYIAHKSAVKVYKPSADSAFDMYMLVAGFCSSDKLIYRNLRFVFYKFKHLAFGTEFVEKTVDRGVADVDSLTCKIFNNIGGTYGTFPAAFKILQYNLAGFGVVILLFRQLTHAP